MRSYRRANMIKQKESAQKKVGDKEPSSLPPSKHARSVHKSHKQLNKYNYGTLKYLDLNMLLRKPKTYNINPLTTRNLHYNNITPLTIGNLLTPLTTRNLHYNNITLLTIRNLHYGL